MCFVFLDDCVFIVCRQKRGHTNACVYLCKEAMRSYLCVFYSSHLWLTLKHQTMVQMVLRLGSKRTTFPSAAFVFVLYMGFSNVACPLLFSWTEHPVYCALSVFLGGGEKQERLCIRHFPNYPAPLQPSTHVSIILLWTAAVGKWGWMVIIVEKMSQRNCTPLHWKLS